MIKGQQSVVRLLTSNSSSEKLKESTELFTPSQTSMRGRVL